MLGCFEEWGWWLVVLGCSARVGGNREWPKNTHSSSNLREGGLVVESERGERDVG